MVAGGVEGGGGAETKKKRQTRNGLRFSNHIFKLCSGLYGALNIASVFS